MIPPAPSCSGAVVSSNVTGLVLRQMAEELFSMQTLAALTRSRSRRKGAVELSDLEFLALDVLSRRENSLTVGEVQKSIGVLPAQMSRIVRALERRSDGALIRCEINRTDKRKVDVHITREGRQLLRNYKDVRIEAMMSFLGALSQNDCREFMRICRAIRGSIEAALP